jgi:fumarate reductase flavoprotein subunit
LSNENQKQHLIGIGIMVVASAVLIGVSQPAYEAFSKAGRVQGTESIYTPGTYEAEEQGFGGAVKAVITVDDKNITALQLTGESETPELGGKALTSLQAEILQKQTAEVDSVSGASITSGAVKTAVSEALSAARGE